MLAATKKQPDNFAEILLEANAYLGRSFEGEMFTRTQSTTLLQLFNLMHSLFKSDCQKYLGDIFRGISCMSDRSFN